MDCRTALEILEAARPDSSDRDEPEVASASAHVETCPECEDRFVARQRFDRNLGCLMRDVAPPDGWKARLLASLDAAEIGLHEAAAGSGTASEPLGPESNQGPMMAAAQPDRQASAARRARLLAAASLALGLLMAVTWIVAHTVGTAGWTLAELRHDARAAYQQFEQLPRFEGTFEPELPEFGWQTSRSIHISQPPRGFPPGAAPHAAAVYFFTVQGARGRPVQGILLVTPRRLVADPPESSHFDAQGIGSGPYSAVAWTERDLVYVCVVEGGGNSLELLQRALRLSKAA